jgi:thymidylate kinase
MLVFVEGIDKAGKSTFIRNFSTLTSIPIYRKLPPADLELSEHHSFFKGIGFGLVELHEIFNFDAIIDRSFISDWVYTNKYKITKNFPIWAEWELRQLSKENFIIYIDISENVFLERILKHPDIYMESSEYNTHQELYSTYFQKTTLPIASIRGDVPFDEQIYSFKEWLTQSCSEYSFFSKLNHYLSAIDNTK